MRGINLNMTQTHPSLKLAISLIIIVLLLGSACTLLSPPPEPPPPEPENQPPVIHSITAEREVAASTECQISCEATDVDGATLNYWWSANGGMIEGEGNSVTWIAPDIAGDYTVKLLVTDGNGGEAIDSVTITVTSKPNQPPTITAFNVTPPNKPEVTFSPPGEQISVSRYTTSDIQCIAEDPDGDELNYIWSATGGTVKGEGAIVKWIVLGAAGDYTVTVIVSDGRGGEAEASMQFDVLCCGH
jgi:predicted secreted protein